MRARNIKPGFYKNEILSDCSLTARLLFPGLWMMADREGRLEDRPKRIKGEIFPYDDFDVDALLEELSEHGFIIRYEAHGNKYIQIVNFVKHQNPHKKEASSEFPEPPREAEKLLDQPSNYSASPEKASTSPADSPLLIPDSPLLNPPSLNPSSPPDDPGAEEAATLGKVIALWNDRLGPMGFLRVQKTTPRRERSFKARLGDDKRRHALAWWGELFDAMAQSGFLCDSAKEKAPWLTFDWILNENKLVNIVEGKYQNGAALPRGGIPPPTEDYIPQTYDEAKARVEQKQRGNTIEAEFRSLGGDLT